MREYFYYMKMTHLHLDEVDSTNTYAKLHFEDLPDGSFVSAAYQTAGRGRLDRKWHSPRGVNICGSFVMKKILNPFYATIVASLSVLDTLGKFAPSQNFFIKWPNDVYVDDSKIAGILSEGVVSGGTLEGIITGMGVNINLSKDDLSLIDSKATSLHALTGDFFNIEAVTSVLAEMLRECYSLYLKYPERVFERWKQENRLLGRELEFESPDGTITRALFNDILPDGSISLAEGAFERIFSCGDIRITKKSLT